MLIVEPICFRPEQTVKIDDGGVAKTLNNRATDADHIPYVLIVTYERKDTGS